MSAMRHLDQAIALHQAGRLAEAEALYRKMLAHDARDFDALHMLGIVCAQRQQFDEAERLLRQAVAVDDRVPPCLLNYGNVLSRLERYGEAVEIYRKALALAPNHPPIHSDLGNAQKELGRLDEALASYDKALALQPNFAIAHYNRGVALERLNRDDEALASYDRALAIVPNYAAAHCNRGMLLSAAGRLDEGLVACERAIALDPKLAQAHANRAATLVDLRRHQDAIASCDNALALDPTLKCMRGLRAHSKLQLCDWNDLDADISHLMSDVRERRIVQQPFVMLGLTSSASDQLRCAEHYCRESVPVVSGPVWNGECYAHDRIRIAYLSADLQEHPVASLIAGVFEQHDRSRFETFGFSHGMAAGDSAMRARISQALEHFIDVRLSSVSDIARMLREREIDIAIDLMGHTSGARPAILAMRPAPVQVAYLGFPGTTGAPWIDYLIADRHVAPEASKDCYSEKIVHLPDTYQANDSRRPRPQQAPTREELGLPDDAFVFCSFNNSYKFTPAIFDVWMRLLRNVDGSVLWILAPNPAADRNLRREAETRGIDPKRIVAAPLVPYLDNLARYRRADLFLDTLPYNAHTTASDALWMGLPVLTLRGTAFAGRVAASLLFSLGLAELITDTLADYEALALRLARDPARVAALKAKLESGSSPLFDTARFTRHIEAAFATMCERARRGQPPESFAVDLLPQFKP